MTIFYVLVRDFEDDSFDLYKVKGESQEQVWESVELYLLNSNRQAWVMDAKAFGVLYDKVLNHKEVEL